MEPDRFDYSPITDRPVIRWPNDARVALWVAPNIEWYEYTPLSRPDRPDIPSYSYRDYGNRVGFWRMLEVLDKHDIRCCVCLNGAVLDHCPEVRDAMVERDWDYMAHGFYNTRPITNYTIEEEREYWRDMIETVKKHTGKQLKGRLGAGGGNTENTTDLMAEAGLTYHTDWLFDDQPFPLKVKNGAKFIHVPYSYQLNDAVVPTQGRDAAYFAQMIKDQFDTLYEEGAESGRVMCISLHPYWIGKAHRAKYLDEALEYILAHDGVWKTTADDIADYYIENYYDDVVAHVEQRKAEGLA
jgi:peptidoglycan/xylan/chitin deacetylase (PgdA/CDA1 family)